MCAHGWVGQTHTEIRASPFLKEFCMARIHFDELEFPSSKSQGLELPQNAETGAPRADANDRRRKGGRKTGKNAKLHL